MTQAAKVGQATPMRDEQTEAQFSHLEDARPGASGPAPHPQRRAAPRFKVELDVSLGSDHNFYVGFVENMSVGGVFIATHMIKSVGEVFELAVHLPNSDLVVKGLGEVRWIREYFEASNVPPGMGVRFTHLEAGCQEHIEQFLATREPLFFDDE